MTAVNLLERAPERARLQTLLEHSATGAGRFVVIEGRAGLGKSALLDEVHDCARRTGVMALTARADQFEAKLPFAVVRQLFDTPLGGGGSPAPEALLAGLEGTPAPDAATLHGLYRLTAHLCARGPLLIVVDDAQWTDPASLSWLTYLRSRVAGLPALVVLGLRPPPRADNPRLLSLACDPATERITLEPLTEAAVTKLVQTALKDEPETAFVRACHDVTRGNPSLVRELLSTLAESGIAPTAAEAARIGQIGPRSVARSVWLRISRLSPAATRLASAVAVLGQGAEWRHAAGLADLDCAAIASAADALAAADILAAAETLEFVHPIARNAIYDDLPTGERRQLHARAARLIAADGAALDDIAGHLLGGPAAGDPWVVETLRDSARLHAADGCAKRAVAYLRRALAEPPGRSIRSDVLRELGAAEVRAGLPQGLGSLREAHAASPDSRTGARAALGLGRGLLTRGHVAEAIEVLETSADGVAAIERELAHEIDAELVGAACLAPDPPASCAARLAHHREQPPRGVSPAERHMLAALAFESALAGRSADTAAHLAERALRAYAIGEVPRIDSLPLDQATFALTLAGRVEQAASFYDTEPSGSGIRSATARCWRAQIALRRGAVEVAETEARQAVEAAEAAGWWLGYPVAVAVLAEALIERNETAQADSLVACARSSEPAGSALHQMLLYARGKVRFAQGRIDEASADLHACGAAQKRSGIRNPAFVPWRSAAGLAHAALGEHEAARTLIGEELELARAFGEPRAIGIALRAAGLTGAGPAALELLQEAVGVLEPSNARLEHARALVDLGSALRRGARRSAARNPLRVGLDLAVSCGALTLATRARTELLATGARPRREVLTGIDSLTPSERRLAELAAAGMTNRQIAQQLFVTHKTVEAHLRSVYRKLDLESRRQLPEALGRPTNAA